jgi:hypothetical protein
VTEQTVSTAGWFVHEMKLRDLLFMTKMAPSKSAADRLIKQGAVEVRTNHGFSTMPLRNGIENPDDILLPVFKDGHVLAEYSFDQIRERAQIKSPLEVTS